MYHSFYMRLAKTFSLDESLLAAVERSRGNRSTSERVNELLKLGLEHEQRDSLEREAEQFYRRQSSRERKESRAFQQASLRSVSKDED